MRNQDIESELALCEPLGCVALEPGCVALEKVSPVSNTVDLFLASRRCL